MDRQELLSRPIEHFELARHDVVGVVEAMEHMAFSARDLHRARKSSRLLYRNDWIVPAVHHQNGGVDRANARHG